MAKIRALNERNAIAVSGFGFNFLGDLSPTEVTALQPFVEGLRDLLPMGAETTTMEFVLGPNNVQGSPVVRKTGFNRQALRDGNSISWKLEIANSKLLVQCMHYRSWDDEFPFAWRIISSIANALLSVRPSMQVHTVGMGVQDKFYYVTEPPESEYKVTDIFKADSPHLTPGIKERGKLWHVHQGWFERWDGIDGKALNILNITSHYDQPRGLTASIDHNISLQLVENPPRLSALMLRPSATTSVVTAMTQLQAIYQMGHVSNKKVFQETVNAKMQEMVHMEEVK